MTASLHRPWIFGWLLLVLCLAGVKAGAGQVAPAPPRVSLSVRDIPIAEALKQLFDRAGLKFVLEPGLDGTVTFSGSDLPLETALRTLLRNVKRTPGLTFRLEGGVYRIGKPGAPQRGPFTVRAAAAVEDLLRHFWVGDAATGHVLDTYGGRPQLPPEAQRGILWERATLVSTLVDYVLATGDAGIRQRLASEWGFTKRRFRPEELQSAGRGGQNANADDVGWAACMYAGLYRVLRDPDALTHARSLFVKTYDRWADGKLGGAIRHGDDLEYRSNIHCAMALAGLRVYEVTGDEECRKRAMALYEWSEQHLLRPDGLYHFVYEQSGPQRFPGLPREGSSDTCLAANLAIGILHARLFRLTGQDLFRQRALRTAAAIRTWGTDGKGAYLNDRDAWADGFFMSEWAREVLTLPGIHPEDRNLLFRSAEAAALRARTPDGHYGGSWNGPAEGNASLWFQLGSKPDQIMTSSSTAGVVVAGAQLEALGASPTPVPEGAGAAVVTGNGAWGFDGDGGPAASARLNGPAGVAVDASGTLYVADTFNHRVRKITPAGVLSTLAGTGTAGFAGDGGPAAVAQLNAPAGVAVDAQGSVYVSDTLNHRIRKITPDGKIATVAGNGNPAFGGDGGPALAASFNTPEGIAVSGTGDLYVADRFNYRVRRVTPAGGISTVVGSGKFGNEGNGAPATAAALQFPSAIAVGPDGSLYVTDEDSSRVCRVTPDGILRVLAGGTWGDSGDGGPAAAARLRKPRGVAVDASGTVYIADTFNHRIRKVSPDGTLTTITGTALGSPLSFPNGLAVDTAGKIYVADRVGQRVRRLP